MFLFNDYFSNLATVEELIQPNKPGRVRFQGSGWPARCRKGIVLQPGSMVKVIGNQNTTLIVEPADDLEA